MLVLLAMFAPAAPAQNTFPKHEIFGGYSYYSSEGWAPGYARVDDPKVPIFDKGFATSYTYNFSKWLGMTGEVSGHYNGYPDVVYQFLVGPRVKIRTEDHFSIFAHTLVGMAHIAPTRANTQEHFSSKLGGGFDLDLNQHWGIRIAEVDFTYTKFDSPVVGFHIIRWEGITAQTGIIYSFGYGAPEKPVSVACTATPSEPVLAGTAIKVGATPSGFLPKRIVSYAWNTTGGKLNGTGAEATVETTDLAPGSYTVGVKATDNGKDKHQQTASCTASFTIKAPPQHPPVMTSCTATPQSVKAGDPVSISASATSEDNRPLTYSIDSTGRLSGSGQTVTLDTAGAAPGPIRINCKVSDDRGLTDGKSTSVNVEAPPPPPPASSKINSINFPDTKKPARVDNAAKAILDEVALRLQREADAKAVIVGFGADTKKFKNLAAQRAVNTKAYLTQEKGIDGSRLEVRTGSADTATTDIWLIPTGATFDATGTTAVDEAKIKAPAVVKPVAKKKAAAKKAE
jgi:outer membrane protein OmpA-like peptidoglycan-associated protein